MDEDLDLQFHINNQNGVDTMHPTSLNDSNCDTLSYNPYIIPTLFFLMFPVALFLNVVAAWVSLQLKSTSTFVVYLKNLVAADIILTLLIPIKSADILPGASEILAITSCRFFSVFFYNTQYTCITLLGCISVDRFFKIMMPRSRWFGQNLTLSRIISASVWVIMFVCTALPNMILTNKSASNVTKISCMNLKESAGIEFHQKSVLFLNVFFWLVSVVIVVCYICITNKVIQSYRNSGSNNDQGKQKIKLRVFLVVIVFFVCFGPYHLVRIPYTFQQVSYSNDDKCSYTYGQMAFAKELTHWLATTNICMDPLIYVFLCREFKEKLTSMVKNGFFSFKVAAGRQETLAQ